MKPTQEQLNNWYKHKSNKEAWIERQEMLQDEIQEDTTSMEEKLEALEKLHNDPKADILADMIK